MTNNPTTITSKLASKAKLASQIASKQTELAKLQKVTLTSAYIKLGRWAYETKSGQEKIPEHFDALSKINASIRKIKDAEPVPVGDDFKSKAKSMAKAGADAGQIKLLQGKLQKAILDLGKAVHQSADLSVPPEFSEPIRSTQERVKGLEAEIEELSAAANASGMSIRWVYVCLIPVFGIGLFLIWISSVWSKPAKIGWTVATLVSLLIALAVIRGDEDSEQAVAVRESGSIQEAYERSQSEVSNTLDSDQGGAEDAYDSAIASGRDAYERAKASGRDAYERAKASGRDAFESAIASGEDAFERVRQSAGGKRRISESQMNTIYEKLVNEVKVGMSSQALQSLLGGPSEIKDYDTGNKNFSIWTWSSADDSEATVSLVIENGIVVRGGTPGYDIRTGFKRGR